MRSGKMMGLLMGSAVASIGAMTPAERQRGRYMRAPDHPDAEFAAFESAGSVETGEGTADIEVSNDGTKPPEPAEKPKAKSKPPRTKETATSTPTPTPTPTPAAEGEGDDEPGDGEDQEDDEDGEDEDPKPKPKPKAHERIQELTKRLRARDRVIEQLSTRMEAIEKGGLPAAQGGGNSVDDIGEAPDPKDTEKYPLGHLDDRYVEDRIEWLVAKTAAERADTVLQRQQESEQQARARQQQEQLLVKVDDLATRGSEIYDDFQESVVDAGMRGDWRLDQPTFEAAAEAEHGVQILYELSQDKAQAKRVAELSPFQQLKFVADRDAEIGKTVKPRTKPGANPPPQTQTRGATSRTRINPATDNLDDFEKAWAADAKGK